jgi:hypothetical protein
LGLLCLLAGNDPGNEVLQCAELVHETRHNAQQQGPQIPRVGELAGSAPKNVVHKVQDEPHGNGLQ